MKHLYNNKQIRIGSTTVRPPYQIDGHLEIEDLTVLMLATYIDYEQEEPDFELDNTDRNVVGLDTSGTVLWLAEEPPGTTTRAESNYYKYIYAIGGELFTRSVDRRVHKLDSSSGKITESLEPSLFEIGGRVRELDGWIHEVTKIEEKVFVSCGEATDHMLYGFNTDGTELWRSEGRRGTLYRDGDMLIEKRSLGPRTKQFYRLDKDTGRRVAEIEVEYDDGWQYVEDISDNIGG